MMYHHHGLQMAFTGQKCLLQCLCAPERDLISNGVSICFSHSRVRVALLQLPTDSEVAWARDGSSVGCTKDYLLQGF